jgi:transposase
MGSMPCLQGAVFGGVDPHKELHPAALVDATGAVLGTRAFAATRADYRALRRWMSGAGQLQRVGVEQTGSYGAGVARELVRAGIPVLEVTGADKRERRSRGKDDTLDAVNAARAALERRRVSVAKRRDGRVEALRVLRVTRQSAIKARRAALQQLRNTIVAAPDPVREQTRTLTRARLLATCAAWRPAPAAADDPSVATRIALRSLARRIIELNHEISALEQPIEQLVRELNPRLLDTLGIGTEIAGQLLVTAGDNPDRLHSEASFAMLCGVAPLPASSGKTQRHRLNRGGDRQANRALHLAAVTRLRHCPRTRAYASRRTAEGLSKREIIRCLKRYIAREAYHHLNAPTNP